VGLKGANTIPDIVPKESWELEFRTTHAIPGSTRQEPAKALRLYSELLELKSGTTVLDAGSGNGRNTVYLAQRGCHVTALDFSEFAVEETGRRVVEAGVKSRVSIIRHFMDGHLPFPDNSFDLVLDSYVFCHFLRDEVGQRFWQDMFRVTRPGGRLLSILFAKDDEYYNRLLRDDKADGYVCDPANGIWKRLYTEREIKSFFSTVAEMEYFSKFQFADVVQAKHYVRSLFICVLRKRL
jgi:SAM-dependent methyltransferase